MNNIDHTPGGGDIKVMYLDLVNTSVLLCLDLDLGVIPGPYAGGKGEFGGSNPLSPVAQTEFFSMSKIAA